MPLWSSRFTRVPQRTIFSLQFILALCEFFLDYQTYYIELPPTDKLGMYVTNGTKAQCFRLLRRKSEKLLRNSLSSLMAIRKYPSMQSIWICTVFLVFVDNGLFPFDKAVMPEENLGRNDKQCIKLIQDIHKSVRKLKKKMNSTS